MRLLFDQNLSPVLGAALADCYRETQHVRDVGMQASSDAEVWAYAVSQRFAIVTKDSDFRQRSFVYGFPPKVIWIGLGNCSTRAVEALLRERVAEVMEFLDHPEKAFLVLA